MPALSFPMVFGIIMSAAVFLIVLGLSQARRAAGGSEDFQARLAAYSAEIAAYCGAHNIAFVQASSGTRLEDLVLRLMRSAGVVR